MADAQAQAVEVGCAQPRLNVFEAVVAAVAAADFEAGLAAGDVQLVVGDEDLVGADFVKLRQRGDGLAGKVHKGVGLEQPDVALRPLGARCLAVVFFLALEGDAPGVRQLVEKPEAGVVAGVFVLAAGVAQADDQFDVHNLQSVSGFQAA